MVNVWCLGGVLVGRRDGRVQELAAVERVKWQLQPDATSLTPRTEFCRIRLLWLHNIQTT